MRQDNKNKNESSDAYDVFISYCHKDKQKADELFNLLTRDLNLRVWKDNKGGIHYGKDFGVEIKTGLKTSKCFVSVMTKQYMSSENCGKEIQLASHFKKKVFLLMFESIRLEDTDIAYFTIGIQRCNLYKKMNSFHFSLSSEFQKFIQALLKEVRGSGNIQVQVI